MPNGALVCENLVVVTTLECLITKEMNLVKVGRVDKLETVCLVPSSGEHIKADLSANGEGQVEIGEFLLHGGHHVFANLVFQVKLFIVIAFLTRAITSNRRNVEHATAKLDKGSTLRADDDESRK